METVGLTTTGFLLTDPCATNTAVGEIWVRVTPVGWVPGWAACPCLTKAACAALRVHQVLISIGRNYITSSSTIPNPWILN